MNYSTKKKTTTKTGIADVREKACLNFIPWTKEMWAVYQLAGNSNRPNLCQWRVIIVRLRRQVLNRIILQPCSNYIQNVAAPSLQHSVNSAMHWQGFSNECGEVWKCELNCLRCIVRSLKMRIKLLMLYFKTKLLDR
jgi:hypothetical protein